MLINKPLTWKRFPKQMASYILLERVLWIKDGLLPTKKKFYRAELEVVYY